MRQAPNEGYDFSRKRDYRRKIWATFRDTLRPMGVCLADAQAALMPSSEGDEIEVALNAGFREWNLHIIDDNPAIVAVLKRKYRRVNTYGVSASAALKRMHANGIKLTCANFDFCGQLSQKYVDEACELSRTGSFGTATTFRRQNCGCFSDHALIAFNMLRGRESSKAGILSEEPLNESSLVEAAGVMALHPDFAEVAANTLEPYSHLKPRDKQRLFVLQITLNLAYLVEPVLGERMMRHLSTTGKVPWFPYPVAKLLRSETYVSVNGQSMLWSVWHVESVRSLNMRLDATG